MPTIKLETAKLTKEQKKVVTMPRSPKVPISNKSLKIAKVKAIP